ncbi:SEP domain-containing protein [Lipomyces oligophaga]|uniref:SEP domain-containing protein n=1 Tax=Lipomyces oligophaga TaxID=45792 RepID=UPI0034CF20C0
MSSSDRAKRAAAASNRVRTLADINRESSSQASAGGSGGDSDNDGSSFGRAYRKPQENFFTGGEKSGLAVQNPDGQNQGQNSLVRDLLMQAERGGREVEEQQERSSRPRFTGAGHTLGSETSSPSSAVEIPAQPESLPSVSRTLTIWADGFTIENGPLMRYDDPRNQEILRAINSGRAPLHLLNVEPGQPVDVHVERRMDEDYVPPNPAKGGFFGSGHRLGS